MRLCPLITAPRPSFLCTDRYTHSCYLLITILVTITEKQFTTRNTFPQGQGQVSLRCGMAVFSFLFSFFPFFSFPIAASLFPFFLSLSVLSSPPSFSLSNSFFSFYFPLSFSLSFSFSFSYFFCFPIHFSFAFPFFFLSPFPFLSPFLSCFRIIYNYIQLYTPRYFQYSTWAAGDESDSPS